MIIEQYLLMIGCVVDLEWFERKKREKRGDGREEKGGKEMRDNLLFLFKEGTMVGRRTHVCKE